MTLKLFQYFFRGKDDNDIAYERKIWAKTSKKRAWLKAMVMLQTV